MMKITWDTDINAPCCPGQIVAEDGQNILVQTDWDFCGVASSFGWSITEVGNLDSDFSDCEHSGTDGTINCPDCGMSVDRFIEAAREWLDDNDGATVDDPGYFMG